MTRWNEYRPGTAVTECRICGEKVLKVHLLIHAHRYHPEEYEIYMGYESYDRYVGYAGEGAA